MNQNMNQELMWKNQNLNPSTENKVKSVPDSRCGVGDVELKDLININASCETYDCSANGTSFEDKGYHSSDKVDGDRSAIHSSFNQFHPKLTPISKSKEFKNYSEPESGSFIEGINVANRSYNTQSTNQKPQSFPNNNISSDSSLPATMSHNFDNPSDGSLPKLRHTTDQHVTDEYLWFYLDPRNNVQGPFLDSQMFQWWSQGIYFQNSLLMKRKCDADFSTLQDYSKRFNGVPFNRKDIRVPPLTESISTTSSSSSPPSAFNTDQKVYSVGPAAPFHRTNHQIAPMTDQNYLLQYLATVPPNNNNEELSKLFHKVNQQPQRNPSSQHNYEQQSANVTSIHNGTVDPFVNASIGPSSSLSNFVNLRLSNAPQMQSSSHNCSTSPPDLSQKTAVNSGTVYTKNDRYHNSSWNTLPQQPNLADSVWMSTSNDTIHSSNPGWSRSTNDTLGDNTSLLNSIFHETQHKNNFIPPSQSHKSNAMQETWDNLDPAIIKIVPLIGEISTNHHRTLDNKSPKDTITTVSTNSQLEQRSFTVSTTSTTTNNNPSRPHNDNAQKYPWADLVRKGNNNGSSNNQTSKMGFNSEQGNVTNHSLSSNQHKTSLTSSSSDDYEQSGCGDNGHPCTKDKDVEALIRWSTSYLENKPGITNVDIGTLLELLIYVESPYELEATMRENVPEFDNISDFVKLFVEKRRPLRQRLFATAAGKTGPKAPPETVPSVAAAVSVTEAVGSGTVADRQTGGAADKWTVKAAKSGHGAAATSGTGATGGNSKNKRSKNNGRN